MKEIALFEFGSWGSGVYLDRWALVHFAWGFMFAAVFRMLGVPKKWAYGMMLCLALIWEAYEWYTGSHDRIQNSVLDVILASAGFWLMHRWWPKVKLTTDALTVLLILAGTVVAKVLAA
jgi:hypothetical protein